MRLIGAIIQRMLGIIALVVLAAVALLFAGFVLALALYGRWRRWYIRRYRPDIIAEERAAMYRMDLESGVCLLIDEYLRYGDGITNEAAVRQLQSLHMAPAPEEILAHGRARGWLEMWGDAWRATAEGVRFADRYLSSFR